MTQIYFANRKENHNKTKPMSKKNSSLFMH
jgi:hypothetical protein